MTAREYLFEKTCLATSNRVLAKVVTSLQKEVLALIDDRNPELSSENEEFLRKMLCETVEWLMPPRLPPICVDIDEGTMRSFIRQLNPPKMHQIAAFIRGI